MPAPKIKITPVTPELYHYIEQNSLRAHPILERVVAETSKLPDAIMQIPQHQGGWMYLMVKTLGVKKAIEVGCYTGYSAIAIAAALPEGGKLTTFDVDPKTSSIAKSFFEEAGLSDKIDLILGSAVEKLPAFVKSAGEGTFDLAFIDADKVNYDPYYESCLAALKSGGILLVDNAFRDGEVLAPAPKDFGTQAVHRLTEKIRSDSRVEASMLPIADGIIMVRKN